MMPVKKLALRLLEKDMASKNAELAVSSVELAARIYCTQCPTRAQSVATRRALNALLDEGYVERLSDGGDAYWAVRRIGHHHITRRPAPRWLRSLQARTQVAVFMGWRSTAMRDRQDNL
jgi:anti-sigma factor RsiW